MSDQEELSPIARQEQSTPSRQPRFTDEQRRDIMIMRRLLEYWSKDALMNIPEYNGEDSRELDQWLSDFWRTETLLSGVVSTVVSIDKNRGWSLVGGRNQVARYERILRGAEGGAGWRRFMSLQSESFWTTNMGAITEVGRIEPANAPPTARGPLGALYHVDPTNCRLTGNPMEPLRYYPINGKAQMWHPGDFFQSTSMPNIQEGFAQLGYCAVMRALQFTVLMVAIYRHDREMLFAAMPKGLLLMSGIDEIDWETAMEAHQERLTAKEREFYSGLSIFFGQHGDLDAKLISLSQLPASFDLESWTNMLMYGYALCFGYDPREFWPVSGGALGTGRETEVQAIKASGKGGHDFVLAFQDNLQREFPSSLLFEFDQRDEAGEAQEAEAMMAYAQAVNEMAAPAGPGLSEVLTPEQRRILYAQRGYIPEEWTLEEEDVTATDIEGVENTRAARDRWMQHDQVRRACEQYPSEEIVRATWNGNSQRVVYRTLFTSGGQALEAPRSYSIPTGASLLRPRVQRQEEVLFEGDGFTITEQDVERALGKWDNRHDEEWAGLPDAESVGIEEGAA